MHLRHRETSYNPHHLALDLEQDLNRLQIRTYDNAIRLNEHNNTPSSSRPKILKQSKTSSKKTIAASRNASTNSRRQSSTISSTSSSTSDRGTFQQVLRSSQAKHKMSHNDRQAQLDAIPPRSMLDRWMGQSTRQDPFYGLAAARVEGDRHASSEKRKGKQRVSRI